MHTRVITAGPSTGKLLDKTPWTPEAAREELARYYSSISYLDHAVGLVIAELKRKGVLNNTHVIFFGDNGFSISHHGLFAKSDVYQNGGLHVPLVIAGPGIAHRETSAVVYLMDVFPTLCELTGVVTPSRVTGRSFVPVLRGDHAKARTIVFSDYINQQLSVRDGRWKLIRWTKESAWPGRMQLFDLEVDPRELNDLSSDPVQAARITRLCALIESERVAQGAIWPLPTHPLPRVRP
jgi:arylsulfatase A-like enzyme